jgi:hypothetical protein
VAVKKHNALRKWLWRQGFVILLHNVYRFRTNMHTLKRIVVVDVETRVNLK